MREVLLSLADREVLIRCVRTGAYGEPELAERAASMLLEDSLRRSFIAARRLFHDGAHKGAIIATVLLCLLVALPAAGQTLPTGCTGTAQLMKCEWAIDAKALGPGVHTLSFTITESNGATVRHSLTLSISSVMLSEASHSARAVSFKLESPAGITSIADATMDGQPFALVVPAP